ncbi:hypothetical protein NN561_005630 [Cricetulus griseus]
MGWAAEALRRARARDPYLKRRVASAGPLPCPRSRPPGPLGSRPPLGVSRPGFGSGEGPRAAPPPLGAQLAAPAWGWRGGDGTGSRPQGHTSPSSSQAHSRLLGSTFHPAGLSSPTGENVKLHAFPSPNHSGCYFTNLGRVDEESAASPQC